MLTEYLHAAMRHAKYELLPEDSTFYGEIPNFQGVYANASTLEQCREELNEVWEEWVLFRNLEESGVACGRRSGINNQEGRLMPRLGPIKRSDLIHHLRKLGFDGPYAGGKSIHDQR